MPPSTPTSTPCPGCSSARSSIRRTSRWRRARACSTSRAAAAAGYRRALALDPDLALAHLQLGLLTLHGAPARERAVHHLGDAFRRLARLPDKERRLVLAWNAHEQKRADEARSLYRDALASYPYDKEVAWLAGRFSVEEDDLSTGSARLERAL